MVTAKQLQSVEPRDTADIVLPPSDLYSDEPPLETDLHLRQMLLLITSLEWLWRDRQDFLASGNLTLYFLIPNVVAVKAGWFGKRMVNIPI